MSKEILLVVDAVSNEKGVEPAVIFEALEAALASATRKKHGQDIEVRVSIDPQTGEYDTFRRWEVVEDDAEQEFPLRQLSLSAAQLDQPDIEVGGFVEEPMESVEFGRIAAQSARQVIFQKVREAERQRMVDAYKERVGELVLGQAKRVERFGIFMDLGNNAEAFIPREELIHNEAIRPGDRIRGYLKEIRDDARGPQLIVSRTDRMFLVRLFELEVPEIGQGSIEVMGAAREPGSRAKIAVRTFDKRLDPVGACVGMRGARVQTVSNELAGERVDIILYDDNPAQFVINAMAPAEVSSIVVDEERNVMDIAVETDKLSLAIGRGGQNVRLAAELTGWELNVLDQSEATAKVEQEAARSAGVFVAALGIDQEVAEVLVEEGFNTLEEVAYVPKEEFMELEGFDEEIVDFLQGAARDALLTSAISGDAIGGAPEADLLAIEGMDESMAQQLASKGICTADDLAELAVDELQDIIDMPEQAAASLIMTARQRWFEDAE